MCRETKCGGNLWGYQFVSYLQVSYLLDVLKSKTG